MFRLPKNYNGLTILESPQDSHSFIASKIALETGKNIIFVALNDFDARQSYLTLKNFLKNFNVYLFPAWDSLPYDRISPNPQIISERLAVLSSLTQNLNKNIIVTTVNSLLTKVIPQKYILENHLELKLKDKKSLEEIIKFLISNSYVRSNTTNDPGEFTVKGSLLDIFPLGAKNPVRIDFFGNQIESIKIFDAITQISKNKIEKLHLIPANEIILNDEFCQNFKNNYKKLFNVNYQEDLLYESIAEKRGYIGMENWLPLFYDELDKLTDYIKDPLIITTNLFESASNERIKTIEDYYQTRIKNKKSLKEEQYNPIKPDLLYLNSKDIEDLFKDNETIILNNFSEKTDFAIESNIFKTPNFFNESRAKKQNNFELLKDFLNVKKDKIIFLTAHNDITITRLKEILSSHDIDTVILEDLKKANKGIINLIQIPLNSGFETGEEIFISEQDLLGTKIVRSQSKKRKAEKLILEASSLAVGEYVVHRDHGIGKFIGLKNLNLNKKDHDFILIEYANEDKLYIPVENLELITRYGSNSDLVKIDSLGASSFQLRKAKLKKKILEIAEELIKVASEREHKKGISFQSEETLNQEFVSRFKFDETDDQLSAIKDVEEDLKSGKIMDRLICGDVGFGKTEIAMRAAFTVLNSNSTKEKPQIAVIVPTTLLARQHYKNFIERFQDFGIEIRQLSRMVTVTDAKKTKEDLEKGLVDIIIGTHALLSTKIKFKNLSLAIIDEEQHFGVKQKEKIKEFKNNVHLLTLSATPIPRTLQMSLTGLRDLSLLATPPIDRMAVRSFIMPFDNVVIREAIMREYYRGGRVFFVCPRIKDLAGIEDILRKIAPEIKIAKAHGGMAASDLDQIMNDFCDGKYDLLLSTTIIESGIDISDANTIIVHHADKFGLSQLYQLRGRVGRSKIRAYAYFTYEARKILNSQAQKRLEVMQTLDGLGAGFTLASHDLDIRGSGNLLGEAQSGHIREVGVELYQDMLFQELERLKNKELAEEVEAEFSPQINIGLSVLIPENYVPDISSKMELYRRIAHLKDSDEADELLLEMEDRFGKIPDQTKNLVEIINIKNLCKKLNIEKLDAGPLGITLRFHNDNFKNPENLMNYVLSNKEKLKFTPDQKIVISIDSNEDNRVVRIIGELEKLIGLI